MKRLAALAAVALVVGIGPGWASGTIDYGSRAGMVVDVVSMAGLDTGRAVIRTHHTRANATAFCRDYAQRVTPECIDEELGTRLNDAITADCGRGEFTDFYGTRYRFAGPSKAKDDMAAEYRILDLRTGEKADGSNASGYWVNLGLYKALCPAHFYRAEDAKR